MAFITVKCPSCGSKSVAKYGFNASGTQRYRCNNKSCEKNTFLLEYMRNGNLPEVKAKIVEMAINGSGVRDTARVLGVSINTVISELKKKNNA